MKPSGFINKTLLVALLLSTSLNVFAIANYDSEEEMMTDLSDFLYKERKFRDRGKELRELKTIVESRIVENPDSAKNYALLGMLYEQIRHNNRKTIWTHLSRDEYFNGSEFKDYQELITSNYVKAVELNHIAIEEDKLTIDMVSPIAGSMLLDSEVAERVIRLEMSLSHTIPELPETYAYNSYGVIYGKYMKVGRYEDALRILDEMQQEFPHKVTEIAGARAKVYRSQNEADREQESVTQEQSKPTPVAEVKPEPPVQKPEPKTVPVVKPKPVNTPVPELASNTLWYILAAIIAVLVIGGVVVKRRS